MADFSMFEITDSEMVVAAYFPVYMEGDNVYFKIQDKAGAEVVSRRNTGVVDQGKGVYSVDVKTFLTTPGTYIIIFDINGTTYTASERIIIKDYEIEQRDFQEFNIAKNPTKVVIKKTRTDSFDDAHKTVELSFDYNSDNTPKTMEEKRL